MAQWLKCLPCEQGASVSAPAPMEKDKAVASTCSPRAGKGGMFLELPSQLSWLTQQASGPSKRP